MRKTALLGLAALAVGAISAMAQSNVYSLNVVGYVNSVWSNSITYCVVAPLDAGTNDLNTLIPGAPNGSTVLTWNLTKQDFDSVPAVYKTRSNAQWTPDYVIPAGKGMFVSMAANFTNTFVGNVRQGSLTNQLSGSSATDLVGSMVPVAGDLITNIMVGFNAVNGDTILHWNVGKGDFDSAPAVYKTRSNAQWTPNYTINVGEGFFISTQGTTNTTWVRNFTVP